MSAWEADKLMENGERNFYDLESSGACKPLNAFGGPPRERHVTFCIDTSGSMYGCLDVVKENIIKILHQHATANGENTFNLIEFSTEVIQWADRMVKCTPETVEVASQWVSALQPKTGTNTVDAMVAAFADGNCDAVYLITDGLSDQNTDRAIDQIIVAAGNRAVHCFYIQGGNPEPDVIEFLREIAMETFGSLHVITIAHHGAIERVAPIYRADMAAERFVRSSEGNVFPTNQKMCSVTTALPAADLQGFSYSPSLPFPPGLVTPGAPPCVAPGAAPSGTVLQPYNLSQPPYPYCLFPWPYRYYCFYASPAYGWSRYRPAKAWINHAKSFVDGLTSVVPSAGAMLIGTKILARRHIDGLFYLGCVKSQILHNKFLVEFGPCTHGRYKDTEYQETFVYDIISHTDALRHPVLVEDKVLAPWEPDGDRYAPGVVIDGQEKRIIEGGGPDKQLVVTFYNGKTASVEKDRAVWVPSDLHERIVFELTLPKNVRKEFAQRDFYPTENVLGYPSSGPKAFPAEFPRYVPPGWVEGNGRPGEWGTESLWHDQQRPWLQHFTAKHVSTKTEDVERVIPGTDLTKSQLNEKVLSQIEANSKHLSGSVKESLPPGSLKYDRFPSDDVGLKKSVSFADLDSKLNSSDSNLKKSVSFSDLESKLDGDLDLKDSGHGSQTDLCFTDDEDFDKKDSKVWNDSRSSSRRDASSATDASLLYPRRGMRSLSASGRRPWKYWKNEPSPSLLEPVHYGHYRVGPYKDSIEMPGLLRDAKRNAHGVEWTSPVSQVVEPWGRYARHSTIYDSLHVPKPPERRLQKQGPGREMCEILGEKQVYEDSLADARRDYRQRQVLEREIGWQRRAAEADYNQQAMLDLRRSQVQSRMDRNLQRHREEQEKMDRHLESRRLEQQRHLQAVSEGLGEKERKDAERIAFRSAQRENRIIESAQRNLEKQEIAAIRQANKELQQIARVQTNAVKVLEDERQMASQTIQKQKAHGNREAHFIRKENEAQRRKQLADKVENDAKAINRSFIVF